MIVGAKRKTVSRRNFKYDTSNGYDTIFTHTHFTRIVTVKIPRYTDGNINGFDLYDLIQSEYFTNNFRIVQINIAIAIKSLINLTLLEFTMI